MPEYTVRRSIRIAAPADRVWPAVRDFGGHGKWMPGSGESDAHMEWTGPPNEVGTERRISLPDGPSFHERLMSVDDQQGAIRYSLVMSPFPIQDHLAEIRIEAARDGSSIATWSATFSAEGVETFALLDDFMGSQNFEPGLSGLKRYAEGM